MTDAAMNLLKPRIPKGFRLKAQGCEERATLGLRFRSSTTLKGLRPVRAATQFIERVGVRVTCVPGSTPFVPFTLRG